MKIATALAVLALVASGSAYANEKSKTTTTTTTERKTDGDGVKTTIETKSKIDGAAGETTRDEKLTLEKHATPDGNTVTNKDVKTSHKSDASLLTHKTEVEEKTVRNAQGTVIVGFQNDWTPGFQNHAPSGPSGVTRSTSPSSPPSVQPFARV